MLELSEDSVTGQASKTAKICPRTVIGNSHSRDEDMGRNPSLCGHMRGRGNLPVQPDPSMLGATQMLLPEL